MSENNKIDLYEKTKLNFEKMRTKGENLDPKMIGNQLTIITKDIISKDANKIAAAEDMLDYLLNLSNTEVDNEIINFFNEHISLEVYECFVKAYARKMIGIIETKQDFIKVLSIWKEQNTDTVSNNFIN